MLNLLEFYGVFMVLELSESVMNLGRICSFVLTISESSGALGDQQ